MSILIGIDGGGTGCRAIVADGCGIHLGYGSSGPANIMTNFTDARGNIIDACHKALLNAGLPGVEIDDARAFLGLAGANIGNHAEQMVSALPFSRCRIVTDAAISLQGAIGDEDGVVAIIGTGSVFIYRTDNIVRTVGGWGFMVGDLGSGSRLGRSLLQETLLCFDGIQEGSALTRHVLGRFENNPQTIVEYAHTAKPGEFGEFAPLVFKFASKNDQVAKCIIDKAVSDIEGTLEAILTRDDQKFCMLGGLGSKYVELLDNKYIGRLCQANGDAASGAVALAVRNFGHVEGSPDD